MKSSKKIIIAVITLLMMSGCAIKTSRTIVEFDGSKVDYSKLDSMKSGKACSSRILGIPTSLDSSVATAAKAGGIAKVAHVDQEFNRGVLGITSENCTVVYGK